VAVLWFLVRFSSLPLLVVLALFRALRFERGLAWLRRGGVGLFYFVDTAWLVGIVTLLFVLLFGRRAYGFGIVVGLFLFVLMHSAIAHTADDYAGHNPAEEFMKQSRERKNGGSDGDGPA
jgi:TRAP-type uncharacterized transport system fused permease subunit